MQLITKKLERRFAEIGPQRDVKDPVVVAKFFHPLWTETWYATEYYPKTKTFFGYASRSGSRYAEWSYFSLAELECFPGVFGLKVERDRFFKERNVSTTLRHLV